jgi:hypothetical protein
MRKINSAGNKNVDITSSAHDTFLELITTNDIPDTRLSLVLMTNLFAAHNPDNTNKQNQMNKYRRLSLK